MDFCNWRVPTANVEGGLEPVFIAQKKARQSGIDIRINDGNINFGLSWQKVIHGNNVEENTLQENQRVWQQIEDLMGNVKFAFPLKKIMRPYNTEFSKNAFLTDVSNGSILELLQRIKTTNWNARFRHGATDYIVGDGSTIQVSEYDNGNKVSLWTDNVQLSIYAKNLQLASKRDVGSKWALAQLGLQHLSVIRFEVRVQSEAKLQQIMSRACGKQIWGIDDLLLPETEANIVQFYFLPILEQIPVQIPTEKITRCFEIGLQAGYSQRDMEQAIGHSIIEHMYPSGSYRNVVVDKALSQKEYERRKSAWQYNKTKTSQILEEIPFAEDSIWAREKDNIVKQLVEFRPFHFRDCGYLPEENVNEQTFVNC